MIRIIKFILITILAAASYGCENDPNAAHHVKGVLPVRDIVFMGSTVSFTCIVEDDGLTELSFQWHSTCGSFQGNSTTQFVYWTAPSEPGECSVTVVVSDGEFTDEYTFPVAVKDPDEKDPDEKDPVEIADLAIGVYYYPWYGGDNFHGRRYLREYLVPAQLPALGEYNDRQASVISQHLAWCEYAGINLWVSSWWGPGKMTDVTLRDHILTHPDLGDMKVALFYETSGRMPGFTDLTNVRSDMEYMVENYFDHPNYYRIDGRPVLFVYLTRVLSRNGILDETMDIMRDAANDAGFEVYIVGDQVFGQPPSTTDQLALLDAVTNYDVYGSSGARMYATQSKVDSYYQAQAGWRSKAHEAGTCFIPATAPGFNDTGVRDGHIPLSRKLTADAEFGSLFRAMVEQAVTLVDEEAGKLFLVTSWNEWHEDTQIEPVAEAPATSVDESDTQQDYTYGMEYEGYGTRYLDILKETVEQNNQME